MRLLDGPAEADTTTHYGGRLAQSLPLAGLLRPDQSRWPRRSRQFDPYGPSESRPPTGRRLA